MELLVKRTAFKELYTIGKLYIDGVYFCDTLEDKNRDNNHDGDLSDPGEGKIMNETCIPFGTYKVIINMSNRFKRLMPLIMNVPGFDGIRIHNGVNQNNTSGCILVGKNNIVGALTNSKEIFEKLFNILNSHKGEISITIH